MEYKSIAQKLIIEEGRRQAKQEAADQGLVPVRLIHYYNADGSSDNLVEPVSAKGEYFLDLVLQGKKDVAYLFDPEDGFWLERTEEDK